MKRNDEDLRGRTVVSGSEEATGTAASGSVWVESEGKAAGRLRVGSLGRAFRPRCPPWWGVEGGQTDGLSLSRVRQQMLLLLLLLFWDFMDSSKRRTCWQQGGVGKDSQWGGGEGEGGPLAVRVYWRRLDKNNMGDGDRPRQSNRIDSGGSCAAASDHPHSAVVKDVETPPVHSSDATLGFLMDWRPIGTQVFVARGQI